MIMSVINYKIYIFARVLAIFILLYGLFSIYISLMWFFDKTTLLEKVLTISYLILMLILLFKQPKKNSVYFFMLIAGASPFVFFTMQAILNFQKIYDLLFPLLTIFGFLILYFLSRVEVMKK